MDNIRESIKVLFNSSYLEDKIKLLTNSQNNIDMHFFNYKENFLYNYSSDKFFNSEEVCRLEKLIKKEWIGESGNIFNILIEYTKDILIEKNNELVCKYSKLFKWRELSINLGEDLLTTSYLAYNDIQENYIRDTFNWDWIIKTDNIELRNILSKGVSENHFHLLGSTPYFDVFWVYFMNSILCEDSNSNIEKYLETFTKSLNPAKESMMSSSKLKLFELIKIASILRFSLFYSSENSELSNLGLNALKEENNFDGLNDFKLEVMSFLGLKKLDKKEKTGNLKDENIKELEQDLSNEKEEKTEVGVDLNELDYVALNLSNKNDRIYCLERFFMYSIFKDIFMDKNNKYKIKLFYIYILIKNKFRNEVMYFGKMYSLDDFLEYNNRMKVNSLLNSNDNIISEKYEKILYEETLKNTCLNQNINSLEARISIGNIEKNIKKYEKYFSKEKSKTKTYYTLHYNKKIDDQILNKMNSDYKKDKTARTEIRKSTKKIIDFYRKSLEDENKKIIFDRILGIDAAGRELNCKPEVFGQAYRALRKISRHKKLWFTYHVGEDFIDLVTGLRSIDEAVKYLELEAYDRVGHALALGIDVKEVYAKRNYKILLKKGELLDNISWLLMNIRKYNINFESSPRELLEIKYKELVKYIFNKSIDSTTYSEVWELRGDADYYKIQSETDELWNLSERRDSKNKNLERIRKMVEEEENYKDLFYKYFNDYETNSKYDEIIEFEIPKGYIELVEKVQHFMKIEIKEKKISIETNPTSNYLIAPLNKYEDHPLKNFFSIGLNERGSKKNFSPQLHVSINTDDQGIFYTCLENEYALVALSLEKLKDENGNYIYNSYEIYKWLDKIREMGLQQSFANR